MRRCGCGDADEDRRGDVGGNRQNEKFMRHEELGMKK
jgi:hypothetical protein